MRRATGIPWAILAVLVCFAHPASAQTSPATLDITARITPTAARPEPVRQFMFYILTRSYADIAKEVEERDVVPPRDEFIEGLKVSKELKTWLKAHETLDLTIPDLDKLLTPDDILHTPEFLMAYQLANGGGITSGMPKPKFKEADKTEHPEKYEKEKQAYAAALKKFIQANPSTISGMEVELDAVNPQRKWAVIASDQKRRVQKLAPEIAQTKYLAAKVETDLDGHAFIRQLAPGNYWVSSLNFDANVGDARVRWDVPVAIQPGQDFRIELTNLNAADTMAAATP
ncbi:MAG TPA: hypothetical protein VNU23_11665 [Candidatus Cybelea sp.]|jgi:hypothetical protein|nr:hypothetical protein [Candidatus Cybelea sp.]